MEVFLNMFKTFFLIHQVKSSQDLTSEKNKKTWLHKIKNSYSAINTTDKVKDSQCNGGKYLSHSWQKVLKMSIRNTWIEKSSNNNGLDRQLTKGESQMEINTWKYFPLH